MNRIDTTFARLRAAGRSALIPYVTAGDPSLTITIARRLTALRALRTILSLLVGVFARIIS